ncbi:hypothetical protein TNCV_41771 [Trichonephila clavipes]|nr:hypothetical protein TNCV_41771 [Trichonephila clavipes]
MVEVKPINISLDQHSPSLSVRTAISPTLTEEFIIHPSVYSEIKKLGHAKSDVLLNESESSLGVHFNSNVPVSNSPLVSMERTNTYRCGQRTVRIAVMACSQKQGSLRAQAQQIKKTKTWTLELWRKTLTKRKKERESRPWRRRAAIFRKLRSACVEVGTHRRNSACVEVGSTHKHLRRGVNSNNFNYITCEEVKSVESKFSSIIGYIRRASNNGARKKR